MFNLTLHETQSINKDYRTNSMDDVSLQSHGINELIFCQLPYTSVEIEYPAEKLGWYPIGYVRGILMIDIIYSF